MVSPEQVQGGLGHLDALSPTVRRLSLEMTDRLACALGDTTGLDRFSAHLDGVALAWVFKIITDEAGRLSCSGHTHPDRRRSPGPVVAGLFDHLESGPATRPVN
jgi:hypothetical protein